MVSHPETGSDPPIGSNLESGHDNWSGMKIHIGDFVRRCLTCQQVKAEH